MTSTGSKSCFPVPTLDDMIYIKISNDQTEPQVTGLEMFHERFIVVADRQNKAIQVIDIISKEIISELKMETEVFSVTKVDEDTVAIGMNTSIRLESVSKQGLLSKNKVLDINIQYYGTVYSKGRLFLACGSSLKIIDMQGKELNKIETDSEGKCLFIGCTYVAIFKDNETIYASDYADDTVTCMTLEGKVKAVYRDSDLKTPCGIAVDKAGHVYVCSPGSNSIHQLSADCTKLQVFKGIQGYSITCTNTNKLIVGFGGRLKRFDLK